MVKENIVILLGGRSVEHEVSIITGLQVYDNINKEKYESYIVYIDQDGKWYMGESFQDINNYKEKKFPDKYEVIPVFESGKLNLIPKKKKNIFKKRRKTIKIDIVFPALHGTNGEDGAIHGMCQMYGCPCAFGSLLSGAIGMDKITMKRVFLISGLRTSPFVWFYISEFIENNFGIVEECEKIGYPLIVKPSNLGSSIGITRVNDREGLKKAIIVASYYDSKVMVEKYIENAREINCAVLGCENNLEVSVCEEPIGWQDILTFEDKYMKTLKNEWEKLQINNKKRIPADLSEEVVDKIHNMARKAFKAIDCSGNARIDFLYDGENIYVNEINTIPGSLAFYLWEKTNISFGQLIDKVIDIAKLIYDKKRGLVTGNPYDLINNLSKNTYKM